MTDRKIPRIVRADHAEPGELGLLIRQAAAEPSLRDYRQRPPVDAPVVLPIHPRRYLELLIAVMVLAASVYGICVAAGKAGL